jgi:hypothetical protein
MKNEIIHIIFHFSAPLIVTLFYILFFEVDVKNIFLIFIGAFFPDIDHLVYLKYKKNLKEFIKFNIFSDRFRKEFLIFHNVFSMFFLMFLTAIFSFFSIKLFLFSLSFLLHLIIDFIDDKFTIGTISHWKLGR